VSQLIIWGHYIFVLVTAKFSDEKYLGDQITQSAKHASTVSKRRAKGFGIISDIIQILEVIKDGPTRIRVGLTLRQTWLVNALCVNVEAWHNVLQRDIEVFTKLDQYLMRTIVGAHSKVPIELLYLETGAVPIDFIISSRRVNYLHNIVNRGSNELVKRVYDAQKLNPTKGDWSNIVKDDMAKIGLEINETEMNVVSKKQFQSIVKRHVKSAAFKSLLETQSKHIKVRNIIYKEFKMQSYLEDGKYSTEQASMLFNMRANTVNGYKDCFPSAYRDDPKCKLGCNEGDSIDHVFCCPKINIQLHNTNERKDAIFANESEQYEAVSMFMKIHSIRTALLADATASQGHREILDTSTPAAAGCAGASTVMC
jgi:hypothetical protein